MKKYLLAFSICLFTFAFPALAGEIVDQHQNSSQTMFPAHPSLTFSFTPAQNNFKKMNTVAVCVTSSNAFTLTQRICADSICNTVLFSRDYAIPSYANWNQPYYIERCNSNGTLPEFIAQTPLGLTPGVKYYYQATVSDGNIRGVGTWSGDFYSRGQLENITSSDTQCFNPEHPLTNSCDNVFVEYYDDLYIPPPVFSITSPEQDETKIKDSWITVSGTCTTNGNDRVAFTNDCSDFSNLSYTVDCVDNEFSGPFYYNGISNRVIAVEKDSVAGDCVDYDDLMDMVEIQGISVIEGYPDDWHFNYDYYDDYDIVINSPSFDMPSLTLPNGSESVNMNFSFVYPMPLSPNVVFNIKQYDHGGNLLNAGYHTKSLYQMENTNSYSVSLTASTSPLHYVVQLIDNGNLKRQFPFGVFVSDMDIIINPDEFHYLFPRLVEKLKKKVVFNYYFAFYDGFYNLFNTSPEEVSDDALDITFKSMSGDGQFDLDIPIFLGSNPDVKSFTDGIRPYVTTFLWLIFALYVVLRIDGMFNSNDE